MGFHNSAVVVVGGQEVEIAAAERSIHAEGRGGGEAAMWPGQDFHRCSAASLQRGIWASAEVLCVEGSLHAGEAMKICYVAPTLQIAWRGSQLTQPPEPWSPRSYQIEKPEATPTKALSVDLHN
jgi:hypothetical protein